MGVGTAGPSSQLEGKPPGTLGEDEVCRPGTKREGNEGGESKGVIATLPKAGWPKRGCLRTF